jgi:hypothetical protein
MVPNLAPLACNQNRDTKDTCDYTLKLKEFMLLLLPITFQDVKSDSDRFLCHVNISPVSYVSQKNQQYIIANLGFGDEPSKY